MIKTSAKQKDVCVHACSLAGSDPVLDVVGIVVGHFFHFLNGTDTQTQREKQTVERDRRRKGERET